MRIEDEIRAPMEHDRRQEKDDERNRQRGERAATRCLRMRGDGRHVSPRSWRQNFGRRHEDPRLRIERCGTCAKCRSKPLTIYRARWQIVWLQAMRRWRLRRHWDIGII